MVRRSAILTVATLSLLGPGMAVPPAVANPGTVSVVDGELGVVYLRPMGWTEYPPRVYRRDPGTCDLATFAVRRCAPSLSPERVVALIPAYGARLEPAGRCRTERGAWDLYRATPHLRGLCRLVIEVAVTELEGTTYVALLQAREEEYAALRDALFEPTLATMVRTSRTGPRRPEEPEDVPCPSTEPIAAR